MIWRITWLLIAYIIGLGLTWWLADQRGEIQAAIIALMLLCVGLGLWLAWDSWMVMRLMHWLRSGDLLQPPRLFNLWKEVAEGVRKVVHRQRRQTRDAEEKLDIFLDAVQASPNGVVLLDEVGRMEWFNLIAAEHFGFHNPQDLGQHIINLVRDPVFVQYWVQQQSGGGVVMPGRQHSLHRPVRLSVQFFPFGEGKRLLLSRDVTAIEQADRMRSDFVANVSHEIRTPLTVLAGFVETLQSIPMDRAETERYLQLMAQQSQRMQMLVQDLLTLSRLEGSPSPDLSEQVDMGELLQQCVNDARALSRVLHGNGQHVSHEIDCTSSLPEPVLVHGSRAELQSAVSNLLNNAVRYTPAGGRIVAGLRALPDGDFCVDVSDDGPGIAREHLARITERFYRVDRSRSRETGGTGLGLAIVKHIAQRHGGTLKVESEEGLGATFSLVLPAQRVRVAGDLRPVNTPIPRLLSRDTGGGTTVRD